MANWTASRAGATRQTAAAGWAQDLKRQWGAYEFGATEHPTISDTITMVKLPKGALIMGGALKGDKIDSFDTGSALLSISIGLDKGVKLLDGTSVSSNSTTNAFASSWALGTDAGAITGYKPQTGVRNVPLGGLLYTDGPLLVTEEGTNVIVTVRASALALTTGTLLMEIDYYMGQHV